MVDTSSGHRPPSAPSTSRNANGNLESEGILISGKTDNYLSSLKERLIVPLQNFEQEHKSTEVFELNAAALRSTTMTFFVRVRVYFY